MISSSVLCPPAEGEHKGNSVNLITGHIKYFPGRAGTLAETGFVLLQRCCPVSCVVCRVDLEIMKGQGGRQRSVGGAQRRVEMQLCKSPCNLMSSDTAQSLMERNGDTSQYKALVTSFYTQKFILIFSGFSHLVQWIIDFEWN